MQLKSNKGGKTKNGEKGKKKGTNNAEKRTEKQKN